MQLFCITYSASLGRGGEGGSCVLVGFVATTTMIIPQVLLLGNARSLTSQQQTPATLSTTWRSVVSYIHVIDSLDAASGCFDVTETPDAEKIKLCFCRIVLGL